MAASPCRVCSVWNNFPGGRREISRLLCKRYSPQRSFASGLSASSPDTEDASQQVQDTAAEVTDTKRRDPLAVLKAMAATIQKVPGTPSFGFPEDHAIYPRSQTRKKEFQAAMDSGRAAADYVIEKYPHLFPMRQADPDWQSTIKLNDDATELDCLEYHMLCSDVEKAIKSYETIVDSGDNMPLEMQNKFLDFVGFHGVGNVEITRGSASQVGQEEAESSKSESDDDDSSSSSDDDTVDQPKRKGQPMSPNAENDETIEPVFAWSNENYAEKVFASITEKDTATYEAFVLALVKYGEFQRGMGLVDEMLEKGLQGSIFLYNTLLRNCHIANEEDYWETAMRITEKMSQPPVVKPNLGTYNALLRLCTHLDTRGNIQGAKIMREMIAQGIEPSLGSYHLLLRLHFRNSRQAPVAKEIANRLHSQEDKEYSLEDKNDVLLLDNLMMLARSSRDFKMADQVFDIAWRGGNRKFIGSKSSAFYGNYICALANGKASMTHVLEQYNKLVPVHFIPREWVYAELFKCIESANVPDQIIVMYRDMKSARVRLSAPICNRIFSALSLNLPAENANEFLDIALDVIKWMRVFSIPVNAFHISQVIRLHCLSGRLQEAWRYFDEFDNHDLIPHFSATNALLTCAVDNDDAEMAMRALDVMISMKQTLHLDVLQGCYEKLELSNADRQHYSNALGKR